MISGFHRKVDENCVLLGYYAESSGKDNPEELNSLSYLTYTIPIKHFCAHQPSK